MWIRLCYYNLCIDWVGFVLFFALCWFNTKCNFELACDKWSWSISKPSLGCWGVLITSLYFVLACDKWSSSISKPSLGCWGLEGFWSAFCLCCYLLVNNSTRHAFLWFQSPMSLHPKFIFSHVIMSRCWIFLKFLPHFAAECIKKFRTEIRFFETGYP